VEFCVTPSGGTPPYTYLWSSGETTSCITKTAAGTYTVTVTDSKGCDGVCEATLVVNEEPVALLECPAEAPDCGSTGNTITVSVTPGDCAIDDYAWTLTGSGWAIEGGNGTPTLTYTAGDPGVLGHFEVVVTDECGCKDTASVDCRCQIRGYCSFTMGGWGNTCPESQAGDMMSTQPGCIRDHYFGDVFGSAGVCIGDSGGLDGGADGLWAACWDGAQDVQAFLPPGGGESSALDNDFHNPLRKALKEHGGNVTGQLLALRLNVAYSCADIFSDLGMIPGGVGCYADYIIGADCGKGKFDGLRVAQFQAVADQAVGGNLSALTPYGASMSDVNTTADCLNNWYEGCTPPPPIAVPVGSTGPTQPVVRPETNPGVPLPTKFEVSGSYPNPARPFATIHFALPMHTKVSVEIFDVQGRQVVTLVDQQMPAGYHSAVWNGLDSNGRTVGSGVYFCRVQCCEGQDMMKKVIKLE
jgi:hypothetical protein